MNLLKITALQIAIVTGFCTSFLTSLPVSHAQEPRQNPYCSLVQPDVCDVETFNGEPLQTYDQQPPQPAGCNCAQSCTSNCCNSGCLPDQPYTTGQGFTFEVINGGGWLDVDNYTNLGNGLFFECDTAQMDLPQPREYVTFVFKGFSARVNFVAVDSAGQIVDEATKANYHPDEGAEVVTLGTGSTDIDRVYMHHIAFSSCEFDCQEPVLSEVRACDTRVR